MQKIRINRIFFHNGLAMGWRKQNRKRCICSNATAAMQVQQFLRCSNAGAAMQAQKKMPHRSKIGRGSPMEKFTPPMEKVRPHRWKRSGRRGPAPGEGVRAGFHHPTDGKGQTSPMEKFTAAAQLPAHD
jgi:hypothetical protein